MQAHNDSAVTFPRGYYHFHKNQVYNFQLNRWHSFGYARFEDMERVGKTIRSFEDWKFEMLKLAEEALTEERRLNAAIYFRAAEFFVKSTDPEKDLLYDRFRDLFYQAIDDDAVEKYKVSYETGFLPALRIPASGARIGTILLHGGFDSFIEEFYSLMRFFSDRGYDVIGFEGPGQGAALRKYGLPLAYEWEKPLRAICDYFDPEHATLIGLSMGGWLCLRAAAFEPRIERMVASGHAIDYMKCMNPILRSVHLWCIEHCRVFMDRMARWKFEKRQGMTPWVVDHFKYITQKQKPLDALEIYLQMNEQNMHPELRVSGILCKRPFHVFSILPSNTMLK
jgi:pimeloyl-ACP methyl ester carboxylesterase